MPKKGKGKKKVSMSQTVIVNVSKRASAPRSKSVGHPQPPPNQIQRAMDLFQTQVMGLARQVPSFPRAQGIDMPSQPPIHINLSGYNPIGMYPQIQPTSFNQLPNRKAGENGGFGMPTPNPSDWTYGNPYAPSRLGEYAFKPQPTPLPTVRTPSGLPTPHVSEEFVPGSVPKDVEYETPESLPEPTLALSEAEAEAMASAEPSEKKEDEVKPKGLPRPKGRPLRAATEEDDREIVFEAQLAPKRIAPLEKGNVQLKRSYGDGSIAVYGAIGKRLYIILPDGSKVSK